MYTHVALQVSDRQRAILREGTLINSKAALGDVFAVQLSIRSLFVRFTGLEGRRSSIFGLTEPDTGDTFAIIFVDKLRLDEAAFTVVADVAIVPLAEDMDPLIDPGLRALTSSNIITHIDLHPSNVAAWKRLLPACVERCRAWSHSENCEYAARGQVPLSLEVAEMPICSCGQGVGLPPDLRAWAACTPLLPFATRAAISPLFCVSYVEPVAIDVDYKEPSTAPTSRESPTISRKIDSNQALGDVCRACSGPGKPKLLACSKCKVVKYCSTVCQRSNWKEHKATCKSS